MSNITLQSTYPGLPNPGRGLPVVLGDEPSKKKTFLYAFGKNYVERNLENPEAESKIYSFHPTTVSSAKYSPNGQYIASGDENGNLKILDHTFQDLDGLKFEYQVMRPIKDVSWDGESERLAIVGGTGQGEKGKVIHIKGGNSIGTVSAHEKTINSAALKPNRPYRLVTGGEDFKCTFNPGPPFKFKKELSEKHTNFVNCVRYSPNGEVFITASSDGRAKVFEGKEGDFLGELGEPEPAHTRTIYSVCFNDDGSQVVTCSGDKTVKVWDVASRKLVRTHELGVLNKGTDSTPWTQQRGCLWSGEHLISVSANGYINYLDKDNPNTPLKVIKGTNQAITAMAVTEDKSKVFIGAHDGCIYQMDPNTFVTEEVLSRVHANHKPEKVISLVIDGNNMIAISNDDSIMFTDITTGKTGERLGLDSQPRGLAARGGVTVVACHKHIVVYNKNGEKFAQEVPYEPQSVAISPSGQVAIGSEKDKRIHIFEIENKELMEQKSFAPKENLALAGVVLDMQYSPDGAFLATGDDQKFTHLYSVPDYKELYESKIHQSRILTVSWHQDSTKFLTGSMDNYVHLWPTTGQYPKPDTIRAHKNYSVTRLVWINDKEFLSASDDSNIKKWLVKQQ